MAPKAFTLADGQTFDPATDYIDPDDDTPLSSPAFGIVTPSPLLYNTILSQS
jgi:hypothetical protein